MNLKQAGEKGWVVEIKICTFILFSLLRTPIENNNRIISSVCVCSCVHLYCCCVSISISVDDVDFVDAVLMMMAYWIVHLRTKH